MSSTRHGEGSRDLRESKYGHSSRERDGRRDVPHSSKSHSSSKEDGSKSSRRRDSEKDQGGDELIGKPDQLLIAAVKHLDTL